jgi:ribosomal protein S18 acetylase RimI-like enzyme
MTPRVADPTLGTHEGDPGKIDGVVGLGPPANAAAREESRRETRRYARRLKDAEVTIRRCRPGEVPRVLDLWAQNRSGHASTPDRHDEVERLVDESPAALLVAEREGEIVGALIAGWDGWRGNMYRLAVGHRHRRRGIGLALARAGEEYLRERGAHRVTALVAFDDDVAGGFWESAGYPFDREIGRRVRNL